MSIPEHVKAEFKIKFKSFNDAEVVLKAIEPEFQSAPSERSFVDVKLKKNALVLVIDAEDAPSLRASVNSYLRWILLSINVHKLKNNKLIKK